MPHRSRKDTLAICGRSGIETLKSNLVRDGYMRGLWVLPEYYEPPQPIKYRPKPEVPPYNPQPLIDVYPQTVNLGQVSETPPYGVFSQGTFRFQIKFNISGVVVITETGSFLHNYGFNFPGIDVFTATKEYHGDFVFPYGDLEYGAETYGGDENPEGYGLDAYGVTDYGSTAEIFDPNFIVAFNGVFGTQSMSGVGNFGVISGGYGGNGYGFGPYGGNYEIMMPLTGIEVATENGAFIINLAAYGANGYGSGPYGGDAGYGSNNYGDAAYGVQ